MTKYAEDVYKKFENKDDGYWVESTGSDPHQDGKHALFLINKNDENKKLVYKPRDLSADFAILGKTPKGANG
jgi:lantibiotic modifying enzyme